MSTVKLSVNNLSKEYFFEKKPFVVIQDLSLTLHKGEFVSIIGPSGCGKSTLFHMIAGIEKPTDGKITIDGITHENRLGSLGYMFQKPLLLPWKTVEENIMLGLTIRYSDKNRARNKAQTLLKRFHLFEFARAYPASLSGGMAQRVALLRTVLYNNEFLLMDEPFGALDALTRLSLQLWLLELWKEFRSSVLFVTHDIREAIFLSDRIYVLSKRPAQILREIPVPFPRPRRREFLASEKALAIERRLEALLLEKQIL